MSETKSITINMGWTGAFVYLACGILYHLMISDVPFAWGNPWLYVDMALWPLWLFGWVLVLIVIIIVIVAAVFGGAHIMDALNRRKNRKAYEQKVEEERRRIAKATLPESK
jgi:uncharacterized membrane protein